MSATSYLRLKYLRFLSLFLLMCIAIVLLMILSISVGTAFIDPGLAFQAIVDPQSVSESTKVIVWEYRVPRTLAAVTVGILMTLAGLLMQASTLNPLADPYLTGMASGALLGVSVAVFLSPTLFGPYLITIPAFVGAIGAMGLVLAIAGAYRLDPVSVVLGGVAVSMVFHAIAMVLQITAGEKMLDVIVWSMGTLSYASWTRAWMLTVSALASAPSVILMYKHLNALVLGDEGALSLGVNPRGVRLIALVVSSLTTAIAVAMLGIIGFVGLVAPHLARLAMRSGDHLVVIPISCAFGALLTLFGDILSRIIVMPGELPLTPVMSLIGVPMLIYLMGRRWRYYGG